MIAAIVVAVLTTLVSLNSVYRILTPVEVEAADQAGQIFGGLFATLMMAGSGYVLALILYRAGMATSHPQTHSEPGILRLLYDDTKNVIVSDFSDDGFYAGASVNELVNFYRSLAKKTESSRFAAFVLEVRRRHESENDNISGTQSSDIEMTD